MIGNSPSILIPTRWREYSTISGINYSFQLVHNGNLTTTWNDLFSKFDFDLLENEASFHS